MIDYQPRRYAWPLALLALVALPLAVGCGKSASTTGGASSPQDLLDKFEEALYADDGEAIARLVNAPDDQTVREQFRLLADMKAARGELEAAIDKAFGPPPAGRSEAFGSALAETALFRASPKNDSKRPKLEMTIRSEKKQVDGSTLLAVDQSFDTPDGKKVKTEHITVIETNSGWKLVRSKDFTPANVDRFVIEKQIVELLRTRTKEVAAGLFKSRAEAEDLTATELATIVAASAGGMDFVRGAPEYEADARRLRLITDEIDPSLGASYETIRVIPDKPGTVQLARSPHGDSPRRVSTADLAQSLREMLLQPGNAKAPAVRIEVAKGVAPDDLLKLFHALVDLRADLPPRSTISLESPADLKPISDKLNGRLKLLSAAGNTTTPSPMTEESGKLDVSKADPSTEKPIGLPDAAADSKAPLEATAETSAGGSEVGAARLPNSDTSVMTKPAEVFSGSIDPLNTAAGAPATLPLDRLGAAAPTPTKPATKPTPTGPKSTSPTSTKPAATAPSPTAKSP